MLHDHQTLSGYLGNFRVFDNTCYPNTLDPRVYYTKQMKPTSQMIIGFPNRYETALEFEMTIFQFPLDHSCPLQLTEKNMNFNSILKLKIRQLKINFMAEYFLRLADYFIYQFFQSLGDTDPYN
jgi:hypothetical protein